MRELTSMPNIGKVLAKKLSAVGICSSEQLLQLGSKEAFVRLKAQFPNSCLMCLYALHGAVNGVEYSRLPSQVKKDLKIFSNSLK